MVQVQRSTVFVGIAAAVASVQVASAALTGADILNFALQLECLEAEFYSFAAFGTGLTDEQRGGGPAPVGGRMADLSPIVHELAKEIAMDEIAHVDYLRAALGADAVPCPLIDIGPAFEAAANAAAGAELSPPFDPYANDIFFLHGGFIFEDVGVTAYRGAVAPLSTLIPGEVLSEAAGVLAVEAYHAGAIRTKLRVLDAAGTTTPYGLSIADVVGLISDLRDAVDGPDDLDQGIVDANDETNIVPTDERGIVYQRSVEQVLAIVYLGSADEPGGFFPEGLNGVFGPDGAMEGGAMAPFGEGNYGV